VRYIGFTGHKWPRIHLKMLAYEYSSPYRDIHLGVLLHLKEFPTVPWMGIDSVRRDAILRLVEENVLTVDRVKAQTTTLQMSVVTLDMGEESSHALSREIRSRPSELPPCDLDLHSVYGIFRLSLAHDASDAKKQFERFLEQHHPWPKKLPGRSNRPIDQLHNLCALRLKALCENYDEAKEEIGEFTANTDSHPSYNDIRVFARACRKAVKHYRHLLGLKESSYPISYRRTWGKS